MVYVKRNYYHKSLKARDGRAGICSLCRKFSEKLEAHHVCYSPEKTLSICHACHFQVHSRPSRFNHLQKLKLISMVLSSDKVEQFLHENENDNSALAKLFAPSRHSFIHALQKV